MTSWSLAIANIKKGKSAAFSLFLLIFIAAILLNVGITIILKGTTFYGEKVKELHGQHVSIVINSSDYTSAKEIFFTQYDGVIEAKKESIILLRGSKFRFGESEMSSVAAIHNADDANGGIAPLKLIEKIGVSSDKDIYLPYTFKQSGGYKLADSFTIIEQNAQYKYRIAGFFEATMQATTDMGLMKFYIHGDEYNSLDDQFGTEAEGIHLSAILQDDTLAPKLSADYEKKFPLVNDKTAESFLWSSDVETVKNLFALKTGFIAMILVVFSIIIVCISLIVIKFRVTNSIEDGIVNIGVLKAIGYTSKAIINSIMLQFLMITLVAGSAAVAVYYMVMPVFGKIISSMSGLLWTQKLEFTINASSIVIVLLLVSVVTLFSSMRIKKMPPIAALRGGIQTHSFKINRFPLQSSKGGLSFVLACKTLVANSKYNIMIALILAAVTFASVFSIVLHYNVVSDKTAFIHLTGSESSDVMIQFKPSQDNSGFVNEIEKMDGVEKVALLDIIMTTSEGHAVITYVSDDYSKLNNQTVFEGRYPKHDNELAISWLMASFLNKEIGDTIKLEVGSSSYSYLITGFSQGIGNGKSVSLTVAGMKHLVPSYQGELYHFYLDHIASNTFIEIIKKKYSGQFEQVFNVGETIQGQMSIYSTAMLAVMVLVLSITTLVTVLILYLVIKTMIIKRKKEFGIMKAIGYTTLQIMNQIMYSFVPIVIIGVSVGGILGIKYTNSMLTLLLSGAGIHNVQFVIKGPLIIMLCIGLVILSYIVSMIVARRIKEISAYELITE
ncbi:ABC transporter permease [Paenibacillus sp. GSMTC-2017]|uniref:ABC transporter permease n=1 Tax=Paenibacillus sp. GSMTC-2017 TaxID=2794350 RepID=UPI0018D7E168|nr:ABC transporter permease [Paenibacillus sp. GSMTC-2017]MBH5318573.1 ABC transporter permease [Paenibacillus sp. GSMTC-2017]